MNKKLLYSAVVIVVLVVVVFLAGKRPIPTQNGSPALTATEAMGQVQKVDGSVIDVTGIYVSSEHPELQKPDQAKQFKVTVGDSTVITKVVVYMPSAEELKKTNGYFDSRTMKNKSQTISLSDFAKEIDSRDVTVDVVADGNIFGQTNFTAKTISYRVLYDPEIDSDYFKP